MKQIEFRDYLVNKQKDISQEGKNVKDIMASITYRCLINLLEDIIEKYDTIKDWFYWKNGRVNYVRVERSSWDKWKIKSRR